MDDEDVNVASGLATITDESTDVPRKETETLAAAEAAASSSGTGEPEVRTLAVKMGGSNRTVSFTPEQWERIRTFNFPKAIVTELNAAQVTADHVQTVGNWGDIFLNEAADVIADHDARKLQQTQEEHHKQEVHHWALDGYQIVDGYLPLQYAVETFCDYAATVFGRALADRGLEWIAPTNNQTVADSIAATFLYIIDKYDLGTVTPALPTLGGSPDD